MVKRIATFGLVLLAVGGCSGLQLGSTAYSSLPPAAMPGAGASSAVISAAPFRQDAALAPVVIPGTLLTPQASNSRRGVNPTAMLEATGRARSFSELPHSANYSKAPALAIRSHGSIGSDVTETGATSATGASTTSQRNSTAIDPQNYNREAEMDRLVKGGRDAAKPICSGC
jgi:hypothetical protein